AGRYELGGLHGAHERAGPDLRRRAVEPAQPIAEALGLRASVRGEMTHRIAQLERLVDRLRMSDQEHVHVTSVPCTLARMKLYGTTTSPFVRRVRVVAAEVGEQVERIDTASDAGQAKLREVSPIRKVPVAVIDGRTIYDSRVINEWLTTTRGFHG